MRDRLLPWLLIVATLLFVLAIGFDLSPLLRGPDEWRWSLRTLALPSGRIILPILFLAAYALVCARWLRRFGRPSSSAERRFLVFLTLAAPLIQLALAAAVWRNPLFEFFAATVSPSVTGYHSVAVTTPNLPDILPSYTSFMQSLPIHPQTHPPGLVLLHWLGWRLFEATPALSNAIALPLRTLQCHNTALMTLDNAQLASSVMGMLVPVIGGLAVWPMYAFGKRVAGSRSAALAAALFPVMPIFAMWPGQWDQVFPLFLFLALYWVQRGLESGSAGRFFSAGAVLSIATFLSMGNAVLIAIVGLYALVWILINRQDTPPALQRRAGNGKTPRILSVLFSWLNPALAFVLGCASMWIVYALLYRVSPFEWLAAWSRLAHEATRCPICPSTTRSYGVWVLWNAIDVATFFSAPLTLLFLARIPSIVAAIRARPPRSAPRALESGARPAKAALTPRSDALDLGGLKTGAAAERRRWAALALATLATFIVLDVSGIVRGETGRMWGYFGPLFALIALAPGEAAPSFAGTLRGPAVLIGLVALQLLALSARWLVTPSFLDEPPERQANFTAPDPQVEQHAAFDRQIALLGSDLTESASALDLTLYWQALAQPPHAYTVFVHILDNDGQLIAQQDNMPVHDQLPTSCWQPREIVADPYTIPLPIGAPRPLAVEVGLYRLDTGERLSLDDGSGTSVTFSVR
ncbi:MAG TPA: glycosyltransferase family 39 protein [Anaerolineae bacterium]|nr:glycosyltransferase family 39 protein [Anaerolineae bacterium]